MSDAPDRGELVSLTVGQVARAVKWGRVAVAAAWAAVLAAGFALGFWFETKKHAAQVAALQAKETAELRAEVKLQAKLFDYLHAEFTAQRAQLWLLADHWKVQRVPAPVVPEKE
jgi:hypothetical protein